MEDRRKVTIDRKGKLFRAYPSMKEKEVRVIINEIIAKNRSITLEAAGNKQKLYPAEVAQFKKEVDPVYHRSGDVA